MERIDIEETEIRSEAVRDFLETIPNWLIRWGILSTSIVLLVIFSAGWWIHYPTIVVADFTLSSTNLPKPIIAKVDGRLEKIFVRENQRVKTGEMLGYLESTASHNEILRLESDLKNFDTNLLNDNIEEVHTVVLGKYYHLGEIQDSYQDFQQNYVQINSLFKDKYFQKRKDFIEKDIVEILTINQHLQDQLKLFDRDVELSDKEYKINEKLLNEKVIAKLDLYREESKLLAKKIPIKNIQNTILNNRALINSKQREILELENATLLQKESFKQSLNILKISIEQWKSRYILISPIDGNVNTAGSLQEKQYVKSGSEVLFISTQDKTYLGEIRIPQANFGKVKKGQKVLIKLQGYPFEEFGSINGKVIAIAELSSQDNQFFWATVSLPKGLLTDANKKVEYKTGMKASAEIITKDMKLIERLFFSFRRSLQAR